MRPRAPGAAPATKGAPSWSEILWRRLTGRLGGLPSGDTTRDSERVLGIERSVYYYLGACHPDFGLYVVAYRDHATSAVAATVVSPFDTGGIAQRHTPLTAPIAPDVLVRRESHAVGVYQQRFEHWVAVAYSARGEYPQRTRPAVPGAPAIDLAAAGDDGRAWMWEGRIIARDLPAAPLEPAAVFFPPGRRLRYRDWVKREASMSASEAGAHLDLIRRVGRDVSEPVDAAERFILGAPLTTWGSTP